VLQNNNRQIFNKLQASSTHRLQLMDEKKRFGFGNTNRRFPAAGKRTQGQIAKDRYAFEQAMAGNDCTPLRRGGDFVVQKRNFIGELEGERTVVDVKAGNAHVTEAQKQRQKRLGRNRHKIVRY
jgi:hypothetical protein